MQGRIAATLTADGDDVSNASSAAYVPPCGGSAEAAEPEDSNGADADEHRAGTDRHGATNTREQAEAAAV